MNLLHFLQSVENAPDAEKLGQFLNELMLHEDERRDAPRFGVCRDIVLYLDGEETPVPGFVRDISEVGVGFTHDVMIPPGEVTVQLTDDSGNALCARVDILWCRELRDDRYVSGGTFVRVMENDPANTDD